MPCTLSEFLLDHVPVWFRSRWPMRRFYWQADEIARLEEVAQRFRQLFGESGSD